MGSDARSLTAYFIPQGRAHRSRRCRVRGLRPPRPAAAPTAAQIQDLHAGKGIALPVGVSAPSWPMAKHCPGCDRTGSGSSPKEDVSRLASQPPSEMSSDIWRRIRPEGTPTGTAGSEHLPYLLACPACLLSRQRLTRLVLGDRLCAYDCDDFACSITPDSQLTLKSVPRDWPAGGRAVLSVELPRQGK